MKSKITLVIAMLISLTGCKGVNQQITDSIYNFKNGGSDQYYAELKNIDIKEKCKNDTQTNITSTQTLLYKREEARAKLNLPELYEDNCGVKKVYASKNEDYINKPIVNKVKLPLISNNNDSKEINKTSGPENEILNRQATKPKEITPKINDFAKDKVLLNDLYYSTIKKILIIQGW